jgi:hypothetical protein
MGYLYSSQLLCHGKLPLASRMAFFCILSGYAVRTFFCIGLCSVQRASCILFPVKYLGWFEAKAYYVMENALSFQDLTTVTRSSFCFKLKGNFAYLCQGLSLHSVFRWTVLAWLPCLHLHKQVCTKSIIRICNLLLFAVFLKIFPVILQNLNEVTSLCFMFSCHFCCNGIFLFQGPPRLGNGAFPHYCLFCHIFKVSRCGFSLNPPSEICLNMSNKFIIFYSLYGTSIKLFTGTILIPILTIFTQL